MAFSLLSALMALIPAAIRAHALQKTDDDELMPLDLAELHRLRDHVAALNRSRAQLIEHIELLERQLDRERRLMDHWHVEATRLRQAPLGGQHALAQYQQLTGQQLARELAQAPQQQGIAQQMAQNHELANAQAQNYQGYCNCVPSRASMLARLDAQLDARTHHLQRS